MAECEIFGCHEEGVVSLLEDVRSGVEVEGFLMCARHAFLFGDDEDLVEWKEGDWL